MERRKAKHPTDEEHRSAEQVYWNRSIIATWMAVFVAGGAAVFSYKAFQETRRQADAADESNRPWLRIDGIRILSMDIKEEEVSAGVEISIDNIGHIPAIKISTNVEGILPIGVAFKKSFEICKKREVIKDPHNFASNKDLLFPSAEKQTVFGVVSGKTKDLASGNFAAIVKGCIIYHEASAKRTQYASSFSYGIFLKSPDTPFIDYHRVQRIDGEKLVTSPMMADVLAE